ncbi:hypothetical protein PIB30_026682 [Stylosanthes scabra]|uniref:Uncharacterized protein n=1 Tax=Stylosanthes scabra TaxID=79078 RepID=A0ABU6Q9W9_9FABA|nr:hypothetical protein [Stylosanthes scabra]
MLGWGGIWWYLADGSDESTLLDPYAWSICCLNPCAMSWAVGALVLVTSQTSSSPVEVRCSHVASAGSWTATGSVCWSISDGAPKTDLESLIFHNRNSLQSLGLQQLWIENIKSNKIAARIKSARPWVEVLCIPMITAKPNLDGLSR